VKTIIAIIIIPILLFISLSALSQTQQATSKSQPATAKSQQTTTKSQQTTSKTQKTGTKTQQTTSKSTQTSAKSTPDKTVSDPSSVKIGSQIWAIANLNVCTFRNGDTIPEAKTFQEWVAAGNAQKPVWCYYNNDLANGQKYGRLYNWYAVNDPRELAPRGWALPSDEDWIQLTASLGGQEAAGTKMKSTKGWQEGNNGTNETGFNGLPGGYRADNGAFLNIANIAAWWSTTEDNSMSAFDHYLVLRGSFNRSNSPKQRGESVRCIRK
jgi:uncharacterized protein (TIGR02145 family)